MSTTTTKLLSSATARIDQLHLLLLLLGSVHAAKSVHVRLLLLHRPLLRPEAHLTWLLLLNEHSLAIRANDHSAVRLLLLLLLGPLHLHHLLLLLISARKLLLVHILLLMVLLLLSRTLHAHLLLTSVAKLLLQARLLVGRLQANPSAVLLLKADTSELRIEHRIALLLNGHRLPWTA